MEVPFESPDSRNSFLKSGLRNSSQSPDCENFSKNAILDLNERSSLKRLACMSQKTRVVRSFFYLFSKSKKTDAPNMTIDMKLNRLNF